MHSNTQSYDQLLKAAETYLNLNDYGTASNSFRLITNHYPQMARGWSGLLQCQLGQAHEGSPLIMWKVETNYNRAMQFATAHEKTLIAQMYNECRDIDKKSQTTTNKRNELQHSIDSLNEERKAVSRKINARRLLSEYSILSVWLTIGLWVLCSYLAFSMGLAIGVFSAILFGLIGAVGIRLILAFINLVIKLGRKIKMRSIDNEIERLQRKQSNIK